MLETLTHEPKWVVVNLRFPLCVSAGGKGCPCFYLVYVFNNCASGDTAFVSRIASTRQPCDELRAQHAFVVVGSDD